MRIIFIVIIVLSCGCASEKYRDADIDEIKDQARKAWLIKDFVAVDRSEILKHRKGLIIKAFGPAEQPKDEDIRISQFNFVQAVDDQNYFTNNSEKKKDIVIPKFSEITITKEIKLRGLDGHLYEFIFNNHTFQSFDVSQYDNRNISSGFPREKIKSEKEKQTKNDKRRGDIEKLKVGKYRRFYEAVKNGDCEMGMPEDLLLLSLGEPNDINETTGSWGVHKQYIYNTKYVYVENGFVTSWQTH